jgi:integrase
VLAALPLEMPLPYALAGYGLGRRVQIIHLDWADVDLDLAALEWGATLEARKYDASQRVVPIVPPLVVLLRQRLLEMGRPRDGLVCPPLAGWASSGLLNTG